MILDPLGKMLLKACSNRARSKAFFFWFWQDQLWETRRCNQSTTCYYIGTPLTHIRALKIDENRWVKIQWFVIHHFLHIFSTKWRDVHSVMQREDLHLTSIPTNNRIDIFSINTYAYYLQYAYSMHVIIFYVCVYMYTILRSRRNIHFFDFVWVWHIDIRDVWRWINHIQSLSNIMPPGRVT